MRILSITLLGLAFMCILELSAHAQLSREAVPDPSASNNRGEQIPSSGNPADEMRYKAAVRQEEENHKDTVERAEEIVEIGSGLLKGFKSSSSFDREAVKKLDRMEKLARKIRSSAGGSDSEKVTFTPPSKFDAAITRLSDLSQELNQCVKKTSRMVVSGTVIERSNELILLIRHLKTFAQP